MKQTGKLTARGYALLAALMALTAFAPAKAYCQDMPRVPSQIKSANGKVSKTIDWLRENAPDYSFVGDDKVPWLISMDNGRGSCYEIRWEKNHAAVNVPESGLGAFVFEYTLESPQRGVEPRPRITKFGNTPQYSWAWYKGKDQTPPLEVRDWLHASQRIRTKLMLQEKVKAEQAEQAKAAAEQAKKEEQAAARQKAAEERTAAIAAANAKGVTAADFEYDITRDGKGIVIQKYKGLATIVVIPAVIEGLPVKEVGPNPSTNSKDESVFPVTRFSTDDWNSVSYTGYVTSITIPDSVTAIGKNTFLGNTKLTNVNIPRAVKVIPEGAFFRCDELKTISLPAGLTTIEASAFARTGLQNITLPDSITEIGKGAFLGCDITTLVLPKNLRGLNSDGWWGDAGAFANCEKLQSVTFQSSNSLLLGYKSFAGCTALTTITINGNISRIQNDDDERIGVFGGCPLTTVNIGPSVTRIANVDAIINAPNASLSITAKAALAKFR